MHGQAMEQRFCLTCMVFWCLSLRFLGLHWLYSRCHFLGDSQEELGEYFGPTLVLGLETAFVYFAVGELGAKLGARCARPRPPWCSIC
jgi:hypothetical protein